jgi:hypothetical protein
LALHLFDALLALSWSDLDQATEDYWFRARGSFLKQQIGEGRRGSNDRLDAGLNELKTFAWRLPVALMSDTHSISPILSDWRKFGRLYAWRFTPEFIAICQNVLLWVPYPISTARGLKKPAAHRLHEMLRVYAGRKFPHLRLPIDELMRLMGANASTSGDRFIVDVIQPAMLEVSMAARWNIDLYRNPHPRIGPTEWVRFTIRRPAASGRAD